MKKQQNLRLSTLLFCSSNITRDSMGYCQRMFYQLKQLVYDIYSFSFLPSVLLVHWLFDSYYFCFLFAVMEILFFFSKKILFPMVSFLHKKNCFKDNHLKNPISHIGRTCQRIKEMVITNEDLVDTANSDKVNNQCWDHRIQKSMIGAKILMEIMMTVDCICQHFA